MKHSNKYLKENHIVISYGRMNPAHAGHSLVVNKVCEIAENLRGSYIILLSRTHDNNKNPLFPEQKLKYARKFFPDANIHLATENHDGIIQIAELYDSRYKNLHVIVGEDRVKQFQHLLNKYNGQNYNYESITVYSAGNRNVLKDSVEGMSGTKLRIAVKENNWNSFYKGLPKTASLLDAEHLFHDLSIGMKLDENLNKEFQKTMLNELFAKGFPIVPNDTEPTDNPDPVKDKNVDWSKIKKVSVKQGKKFSGFRTGIVGTKLGDNMGTGVGRTYDIRADGGAGSASGGIGDPSFRESIDSPYETPFMPAYGFHGSSNQEPFQNMGNKVINNTTGFTLKKSKKSLQQLRKSMPIG